VTSDDDERGAAVAVRAEAFVADRTEAGWGRQWVNHGYRLRIESSCMAPCLAIRCAMGQRRHLLEDTCCTLIYLESGCAREQPLYPILSISFLSGIPTMICHQSILPRSSCSIDLLSSM
jgi:hypothetical protein